MYNLQKSDLVSCDSCMTNIVYGDEYSSNKPSTDIVILCADCYAEDYAADQRADALMRLQVSQARGILL